ncbi:MAG: energy transducer TonB [Bdellovibrionales bacterium]
MSLRTFSEKPVLTSTLIHGSFLLLLALILLWKPRTRFVTDLEVFEVPVQSTQPLTIEEAKPKLQEETPRKAIFGVTKKSHTDSTSDIALKAGNTVAKTPDLEKLNPEDETALPIPTDEFLVSDMPKLKSEVRIPYPTEAKQAGIQGPVVLNLLIDATGSVREVQLVQGPGYGLNEAALEALKQFKFEPAKVQNNPVAVRIRYTYRFVLER